MGLRVRLLGVAVVSGLVAALPAAAEPTGPTAPAPADCRTMPVEDVAAGVLPGPGNPCGRTQPVTVVRESAAIDDDEGRAMLQIVHGIAPGATLMFAAGPPDDAAFSDVLRDLADRGVDVIVDDVGDTSEPAYQAGIIEGAIADVRARGVVYLSAVGNYNSVGVDGGPSAGRRTGSWETLAYRPTGCPDAVVAVVPDALDCLDFDPGEQADPTLGFGAGSSLVQGALQWAEPWFGVTQDFALAVLQDGAVVGGGRMRDPTKPTLDWAAVPAAAATTSDLSVVVIRLAASAGRTTPRIRVLFTTGGSIPSGLEYDRSTGDDIVGPTATGHNAGVGVLSIAAADYRTPTVPRSYSSQGPRVLLFAPVDGTTPAAALPAPQVLGRPTVMAVDGVHTSFFGSADPAGYYVFQGTSAAAPAAAAVVALGLQAKPGASPDEVTAALTAGARPVTSPSVDVPAQDAAGAGLIDASAFLALLAPPVPDPTATASPEPTPTPTPTSAPTVTPAPAVPTTVVTTTISATIVAEPAVPRGPALASTGGDAGRWTGLGGTGVVLVLLGAAAIAAERRWRARRP